MILEQIKTSVNTIITLCEDIDEQLGLYCEINSRTTTDENIVLKLIWNSGYDIHLKSEVENCKIFNIDPKSYWNKELFEINNFIKELEGVSYDEEIDSIADKKEARGEELLNAYRGK